MKHALALSFLAVSLMACRGAGPSDPAPHAGGKAAAGSGSSAGSGGRPGDGSGSSRAGSGSPGVPAPSDESWHEADTAFRLVVDEHDALRLEADALIHAGVEIYAVRDEHALASLIGASGADEATLRADTSRAIAASRFEGRPELAQPPAPGPAHALELTEFRTLEVADPSRPLAIPLAAHRGLRLVCVRAGRRVAAVPVARGPLALVLARAGVDLVGLAARGPIVETIARAWLVVAGRLVAAEPAADGSLRWRGEGARPGPALAVARSGDDWAIARIEAADEPPRPFEIFAFGDGRPGSPWDLIATGGPGIAAHLAGLRGGIRERVAFGANGGRARFVPLEDDAPARIEAYSQDRLERPIEPDARTSAIRGGDARSRPDDARLARARPLAAITVAITLDPPTPVAGEPVALALRVRDGAGAAVAAFEVVRQDRPLEPAVSGRDGACTLELGPLPARDQVIALELRLPDGSARTLSPRVFVLPSSGLAVTVVPAGAAVVAPGTPLAAAVFSRHAGEHTLRVVRPAGDVVEQLALDPTRTPVAYLYPRARGLVYLELVAPTGEVARSVAFSIGGGPGTSGDSPILSAGAATIGLPWPVVVRTPAGEAGLLVIDHTEPPAIAVIPGGTVHTVDGLAPSRAFRIRPRAVLHLPRTRHLLELEVAPEAGGTLPLGDRRGATLAFADRPGESAGPELRREAARWVVPAWGEAHSLYRVPLRLVDLWCFQASAALARGDARGAAVLVGRILAAYPAHPAARGILIGARRAQERAGAVEARTPLERLRAVKLQPRWNATPLVLAVAEIRDLAGIPIALDVADPYRPITLELTQPVDGDALLRRILDELALSYRLHASGVVVEERSPKAPAPPPTQREPFRWVSTFRTLDRPLCDASADGAPVPIPPGSWRMWLFPPGGGLPEWRDVGDPAGGRLDAVVPAFLRPGDRAQGIVIDTAAAVGSSREALALAAEPPPRGIALVLQGDDGRLELTAPADGLVSARLARGARALDVAIPIVADTAPGPASIPLRLDRDAPIEVDGPATLRLETDRLAWLLSRLAQAPPPASALDAARRLVVERLAGELKSRWMPNAPTPLGAPRGAAAALAELEAIPLAGEPTPIADAALALALAHGAGGLPAATLAERIDSLRLRAALRSTELSPAARAAVYWALAAHSASRKGTPPVSWDELGPIDLERADVLSLARLARAARTLGERERAAKITARLERAAIREARGDARFEALGVDGELASAEAAAALLEADVASSAGQAAAAALLRAPAIPPGASWAVLEAIARSIPEQPTAAPTRIVRLVVDGKTVSLDRGAVAAEGALELELAPGRHAIALGAGMRPATAELRRAPSPGTLAAQWDHTGPVSAGQVLRFTAQIGATEDRGRVLVVPLPAGCRARVTWAGGSRYDAARGELVLALDAPEATVEIEVRALIPGRYALPAAWVQGSGGDALLVATASTLDVVAAR